MPCEGLWSAEGDPLDGQVLYGDVHEIAQSQAFGRVQHFQADDVPIGIEIESDTFLDVPALRDRYIAKVDVERICFFAVLDLHREVPALPLCRTAVISMNPSGVSRNVTWINPWMVGPKAF